MAMAKGRGHIHCRANGMRKEFGPSMLLVPLMLPTPMTCPRPQQKFYRSVSNGFSMMMEVALTTQVVKYPRRATGQHYDKPVSNQA